MGGGGGGGVQGPQRKTKQELVIASMVITFNLPHGKHYFHTSSYHGARDDPPPNISLSL